MRHEIVNNGTTVDVSDIMICTQPNKTIYVVIWGGTNPLVNESLLRNPDHILVNYYRVNFQNGDSVPCPFPTPNGTRVKLYPTTDAERQLMKDGVLWMESNRMGINLMLTPKIDNQEWMTIFDDDKRDEKKQTQLAKE